MDQIPEGLDETQQDEPCGQRWELTIIAEAEVIPASHVKEE